MPAEPVIDASQPPRQAPELPAARKRLAFAVALALLITVLDALTGSDIRLYPLYFLPIGIVSIALGSRQAVGFALFCALLWLASKLADGTHYDSLWIWAWNTAVQGMAFSFVAVLVSRLQLLMQEQRKTIRLLQTQHEELAQRGTQLASLNTELSAAIHEREDAERISRHDLKTPLASIAGISSLLRQQRHGDPELAADLEMIEANSRRALNMVNLSLVLHKIEAGHHAPLTGPLDVARCLETVIGDLQAHAASKQVVLRVDRRPGDLFVQGDELLTYSLLANLVKNAIEAAPEGSAVSVAIDDPGPVEIRIHNPGAVAPEMRDRFFEKYATHGKPGGSGLGAYSAKLMAVAQHGSLRLHTDEDAGTTLILQLPRAAAGASPDTSRSGTQRPATEDRPPQATSHLNVLIVDDDQYNRLLLERHLRHPKLSLRTAINGKIALQQVMQVRPDLIFMDIEMPVMGGIEALAEIRRLQGEAHQPPSFVVAYSAHDDEASIRKFLACGFDNCLSKPAGVRDINAILDTVERQRSRDVPTPETVYVPTDLMPLIPEFIASRRELVQQLLASVARGDREELRRINHQLKGSFAMFSFATASDLCSAIEAEAHCGDVGRLGALADELARHMATVCVLPATETWLQN